MKCDFKLIEGTAADYRCVVCGLTLRGVKRLPIHAHCNAGAEPMATRVLIQPMGGPGTELKELLASLGIEPLSGCKCEWQSRQMDAWGVAGCRINLETIVGWLRESYGKVRWSTKLKAAARAVAKGLALSIDVRDPARSLVELAIRRAEFNESPAGDG